MQNKINYVVALVVFASTVSMCANEPKPFENGSTAHWYFNLRTNINAASWIAGIASVWHVLSEIAAPTVYEFISTELDSKQAFEVLKNSGKEFKTTLYLAGLALAFEGFNKFYLRDKYYGKLNAIKE